MAPPPTTRRGRSPSVAAVALLVLVGRAATAQGPAQGPAIAVDTLEVDLGKLLSGTVKTAVFELRNAGQGDLEIDRVHASCGCLQPSMVTDSGVVNPLDLERGAEPLVIAAGKHVRLNVEFNSAGRKGEFRKQVQVSTSDPHNRVLTLHVRAMCDPGYQLVPPKFEFDAPVIHGRAVTRSVFLEPSDLWDCHVTEVISRSPGVDATWTVDPGPPARTEIRLTITEKAAIGHVLWPVEVRTDSELIPRIMIPVRAEVTAAVRFTGPDPRQPLVLDFGVIDGSDPVSLELEILNHTPEVPYHVGRVTIDSPEKEHFDVEVITREEGVAYTLRVTALATLPVRPFRGELRIESDHPQVRRQVIQLRGWVRRR